jgi:uncharacterized cupin superfamily protein
MPFKINMADLPWVSYAAPHGHFGSTDKDLTDELDARKLSCVLTKLEPGQVSCPYHFHHAIEELFIVMEGTGTLRYAGERHPLKPQDVVSCPTGPGGAHQFIADAGVPLVYLAISTVEPVEICEYPDSGKIMAYARHEGGKARYILETDKQVDYFHGEPSS